MTPGRIPGRAAGGRRATRLLLGAVAAVLAAAGARPSGGDGATVASGTLPGDATWEGEVRVEGTATVPRDATLTVAPGTVVRFGPGASLRVEGRLAAAGEEGRPARFVPAGEGGPGSWEGIAFEGSREGSRLVRCEVRGAVTAVAVSGCAPEIRGCELLDGKRGIVASRNAAPWIAGNGIRRMEQGGVVCEREAAPRIEENVLERCGPFGIRSAGASPASVRGNVVGRCGEGIRLSGAATPVTGNVLRGNGSGIVVDSVGEETAVRGNVVEENGAGIVCLQFASPLVAENRIRENVAGIVCARSSAPLVRNNEIGGNQTGIYCTNLSNARIEANGIAGNRRGIALTLSSYAVVRGNNIDDNEVHLELENMSSDWERRVGGKPVRGAQARAAEQMGRGVAPAGALPPDGAAIRGSVDATGNWWGEETTREMAEKGPDADIARLTDAHDVPVRTYEGYEGEYLQDRIQYEGWKPDRIPGAGLR